MYTIVWPHSPHTGVSLALADLIVGFDDAVSRALDVWMPIEAGRRGGIYPMLS